MCITPFRSCPIHLPSPIILSAAHFALQKLPGISLKHTVLFYASVPLPMLSSLSRMAFDFTSMFKLPESLFFLSFFFFLELFFCFCFLIYLFLFWAVLGLRFCARAFSSCGKRGPLFIAVHGPLTIVASPIAEHRLQTRRFSSCGSRA